MIRGRVRQPPPAVTPHMHATSRSPQSDNRSFTVAAESQTARGRGAPWPSPKPTANDPTYECGPTALSGAGAPGPGPTAHARHPEATQWGWRGRRRRRSR